MSITVALIFAAIYFCVTLFLCRGIKPNTKGICLASICIALTIVLECIHFPLPTGATIPLASMLPLMVLSVCNYKLSMIAGFVTGVLAMLFVPTWQPIHWGQVLVEHLTCFSCIGYTAIFGTKNKGRLIAGIILASFIKIVGHTLSGVLFFSQNAWDGWGAWGYSLIYNTSQNVPLAVLCAVIFLLIPQKTLRALTKERTR